MPVGAPATPGAEDRTTARNVPGCEISIAHVLSRYCGSSEALQPDIR